MVDFFLHSQLKHGILPRNVGPSDPGSQIQVLGGRRQISCQGLKPGSPKLLSWPPLWKRGHQSSADFWRWG